jgi:hypothetical protein
MVVDGRRSPQPVLGVLLRKERVMLTKDLTLHLYFAQNMYDERVFGFYCGYNTVKGKGKNYKDTPEYKMGWEEGKSLRFDEMVAKRKFELRR